MSTLSAPTRPVTDGPGRGGLRAAVRRVRSLTRAELVLLRRNRMALFMTVAMPVATAFLFSGMDVGDRAEIPMGSMAILLVSAFAILFVVYYNLVTTYVARREELVLKRLRTGEMTDTEILGGTAVASVAITVVQVAVIAAVAPIVLDVAMPVNVLLVVVGVVAGAIVFVPLAAASSVFTRSVEMAQITTLPVLLLNMMFSGLVVPLSGMPDPIARAAELLPLTPAVELMQIGLLGVTSDGTTVDFAGSFGAAVPPVAILAVWAMIGAWMTRRWFRWEARR